jgi:hypothetical protein
MVLARKKKPTSDWAIVLFYGQFGMHGMNLSLTNQFSHLILFAG